MLFLLQETNTCGVEELPNSESEDEEDDDGLVDVEDMADAMSNYPLKKR